jgi:hypothetical protein
MVKSCIFEYLQGAPEGVLREAFVGFGAKIVDLRDFFENTIYCATACIKIAYMVKYRRKNYGMQCPFFNASLSFQGIQGTHHKIVFLQEIITAPHAAKLSASLRAGRNF